MSFPAAIASFVGVPSSVRVGIVVEDSPLRVNIQGTVYVAMGYIGSLPAVDDVVAVIGQSTSVTSSPTSWLVLGKINPGG